MWIGHTLRGESLLKTVIEGKEIKRKAKTNDAELDDGGRLKKLKEEAQQREGLRRQTFEPV